MATQTHYRITLKARDVAGRADLEAIRQYCEINFGLTNISCAHRKGVFRMSAEDPVMGDWTALLSQVREMLPSVLHRHVSMVSVVPVVREIVNGAYQDDNIQDGFLNRRETAQLLRGEEHIDRMEAHARADGYISPVNAIISGVRRTMRATRFGVTGTIGTDLPSTEDLASPSGCPIFPYPNHSFDSAIASGRLHGTRQLVSRQFF